MLKVIELMKKFNGWEDILSNAPYNLKISRYDGYVLLKYSQIDSDFSNEIVKECRGLILRESDFTPVCVPFFKFMNAEEPTSDLDRINWNTASVQEKIDGSLMKVWFDRTWHISTNGTIDAFQAPLSSIKFDSFGKLFLEACPFEYITFDKYFNKDYTYMFELVSPENRVVIPYTETKLYFLGKRNNKTLLEESPEDDTLLRQYFDIPKRYPLRSYEEVRKVADELPWQEEGFVVCDKNFTRVKIKSLNYLKAHYARSNGVITYERLMDIVLSGEKEEFLIYASDFKDELENIERIYRQMVDEIRLAKEELKPENFATRKDFALEVLKKPKWMQGFIFKQGEAEDLARETTSDKWIIYMKNGGYLND